MEADGALGQQQNQPTTKTTRTLCSEPLAVPMTVITDRFTDTRTVSASPKNLRNCAVSSVQWLWCDEQSMFCGPQCGLSPVAVVPTNRAKYLVGGDPRHATPRLTRHQAGLQQPASMVQPLTAPPSNCCNAVCKRVHAGVERRSLTPAWHPTPVIWDFEQKDRTPPPRADHRCVDQCFCFDGLSADRSESGVFQSRCRFIFVLFVQPKKRQPQFSTGFGRFKSVAEDQQSETG